MTTNLIQDFLNSPLKLNMLKNPGMMATALIAMHTFTESIAGKATKKSRASPVTWSVSKTKTTRNSRKVGLPSVRISIMRSARPKESSSGIRKAKKMHLGENNLLICLCYLVMFWHELGKYFWLCVRTMG